jgi:hypothetical protein
VELKHKKELLESSVLSAMERKEKRKNFKKPLKPIYLPRDALASSTTAPASETETKEETDKEINEGEACVICCNEGRAMSLGECNHRILCFECSLRLRELYSDFSCPLCKVTITFFNCI